MADENVNMEAEPENTQPDAKEVEKQQEAMLRSKYPQINRAPGGGSALLHKRLQHKQKFFDSGDYNKTKSLIGHKPMLTPTEKTLLTESTGNEIPTAQEVHKRVTHRTSSLASDEPLSPNQTD